LRTAGIDPERALPSESAIRRTLALLDPAELDTRVAAWTAMRAGTVAGRRVTAIDGKTMRGARHGDTAASHLVVALDHATGTVLGQLQIGRRATKSPRCVTCWPRWTLPVSS
jgi:hypothetical protein